MQKNIKNIIIIGIAILGSYFFKNKITPHSSSDEFIFTKHALCRMDCRKISEDDIKNIVSQNHINEYKSNLNDQPCPTKAFEGKNNKGEDLRIVVGECASEKKIITVINLDKDYPCYCH